MKALITGIRGMDGSYLSEYLLGQGYEVHGLVRRTGTPENNTKVSHIISDLNLHYGDLNDFTSIIKIIQDIKPDEIYNFGAISNVPDSFYSPALTIATNGNGFINILESVKTLNLDSKIYQASTTELFGKTYEYQDELTPMNPQSPYAVGKYVAHKMGEMYRNAYDMYVVCGILGNHEGERRGYEFVTRKITSSVARIFYGKQDKLLLGNLEPKRDWGYAKEYMTWVHIMMQQRTPDTFCLGTGENYSIKEFVDLAFAYVNLNPDDYVVQDPKFYRPQDVPALRVNYTKANETFGFAPKVQFKELVNLMMANDLGLEFDGR